jgi:antibiotic biosynthesis monooxygenase (ABM) superfamily enzyme
MWLVSLLAIYPLVVIFQATIVPTIKPWPLLVRSAVLPLTLLTLMTFLVMPVVTRVVQPWLSRGLG